MRPVLSCVLVVLAGCAAPPRESARTDAPAQPAAAGQAEARAATILAFNEGPTVDAAGNVYFTETVFERIIKMRPDGTVTVFRENSNAANGLLIDNAGRLLACEGSGARRIIAEGAKPADSGLKPRVTRTDLTTGKVEVLADGYEGKPFDKPNDITMDNRGRLYFTDLPGGAVYRIDTDRKLTRLLTRPEIQRPNGISISPDDKTLYLVEANQAEGGARMIRAYNLNDDGSLANMRVFHNFYPGRSADGVCMDSAGNLHAVAGLHQRRGSSETLDTKPGVHVFSPQGKLLRYIPIPEDTVTNCAFGGPDRKTLYVTAGKGLYQVPVETPGTTR
ncbi:MAG: SMP-30/gluconolactonase/LRE family protein [Bryobacterales bacterium]|nr:SMP-30/gluconolactonase/LRE family protein [Bryobacterales bacterium]